MMILTSTYRISIGHKKTIRVKVYSYLLFLFSENHIFTTLTLIHTLLQFSIHSLKRASLLVSSNFRIPIIVKLFTSLFSSKFDLHSHFKSFSQKSHLDKHIRIHTCENPYQSTSFDNKLSQRNSPHQHMNTHNI